MVWFALSWSYILNMFCLELGGGIHHFRTLQFISEKYMAKLPCIWLIYAPYWSVFLRLCLWHLFQPEVYCLERLAPVSLHHPHTQNIAFLTPWTVSGGIEQLVSGRAGHQTVPFSSHDFGPNPWATGTLLFADESLPAAPLPRRHCLADGHRDTSHARSCRLPSPVVKRMGENKVVSNNSVAWTSLTYMCHALTSKKLS